MKDFHINDLKPLGLSVESGDYDRYEYKGYCISLYLTVIGGTRVRLVHGWEDITTWELLCDWCCGNDKIFSPTVIVSAFSTMVWFIYNMNVEALPYNSSIKPIFNDDEFLSWWRNEFDKIPLPFIFSICGLFEREVIYIHQRNKKILVDSIFGNLKHAQHG